MHNSAVIVNTLATQHEKKIPGCLPYHPCAKPEVIRAGKKVRTIQVESQANVIVLKHYFDNVVTVDKDVGSGQAIGLSTINGDFKTIIFCWYEIFLRYYPKTDWNTFLEYLATVVINESDKTAWESSTNEVDGVVYIISLLARINTDGINSEVICLLQRALADYMCPGIQISGERVFFSPWRIASGSYLTSHGNTYRHRSMNDYVCDFIETHGGYGRVGCFCKVCIKFGVGPRVDAMELDFMRAAYILGDDYLAICTHPQLFNDILDFVFGTTTTTEPKNFFFTTFLKEAYGCRVFKEALLS